MQNLLILDTETTGLSLTTSKLVEIAAILYNVPTRSILSQFSTLLPVAENAAIGINKIQVKASQLISEQLEQAGFVWLNMMAFHSDAVVAHNASFDRQWFDSQPLLTMPWICTYKDINWSPIKNTDLVRLAVAHDVPIINAHNALNDCNLLASIFSKRNDLEELLFDALKPKYRVKARVTKEQKDMVKGYGFKAVYLNGVFSHWEKLTTDKERGEFPFDCDEI